MLPAAVRLQCCAWAAGALLVACGAPAGSAAQTQGVVFENAWIRAPIGGQTTAAGYCDIANHTAGEVVVTGFGVADHAGALRIEIHETTQTETAQGTVARMRPVARLAIPAGGALALRPGGKHLMLFGMDGRMEAVDVRVAFADGAAQTVRFVVRSASRPRPSEVSP